jgi:hypothetical protein
MYSPRNTGANNYLQSEELMMTAALHDHIISLSESRLLLPCTKPSGDLRGVYPQDAGEARDSILAWVKANG